MTGGVRPRGGLVEGLMLLAGALTPLAAAVALVPLRQRVPNASVALALGVVVIVVAATGRRVAAAVAAVSAGVWFDVLHTRPYGSLAITHVRDVETTLLLLVTGLAVGQLASRSRRHRLLAAQSGSHLERIHAVAEMVAHGTPADEVMTAVARELRDLLVLRDCWFDVRFADKPGPFIEREGGVGWGRVRWGITTIGMPDTEVSLIVQSQGRPLGRYVLRPTPGHRVGRSQLVVAVALADQVGAALNAQGIGASGATGGPNP